MDLSSVVHSLQAGFAHVPPVAIGLALLAGPTAVLLGYRLISTARRMRLTSDVEAAPLWVCHDCRSVNELRLSRCYHCGHERDAGEELELIVDHPQSPLRPFEVPAGSPFAAVAAEAQQRRSVPVMAAPASPPELVAVGPGRGVTANDRAVPNVPEPVAAAKADTLTP